MAREITLHAVAFADTAFTAFITPAGSLCRRRALYRALDIGHYASKYAARGLSRPHRLPADEIFQEEIISAEAGKSAI